MRFTRPYHALIGHVLRVLGAVFVVLLSYTLFFIIALILAFFLIPSPLSGRITAVLLFVFTALAPLIPMLIPIAVTVARPSASHFGRAVSAIQKLVSGKPDVRVHELVVDRSGLTILRKGTRNHLPWRDIAQIGVLQPERRALNHRLTAGQYTRTHVLVVRLRPEVPAPGVVSVLSDEHRQLGYLGLCTVESLGSSRQEMTSALERFAGGKLVHSSRQFLDRDPRLRPEMV